jgi:hypothetical protein
MKSRAEVCPPLVEARLQGESPSRGKSARLACATSCGVLARSTTSSRQLGEKRSRVFQSKAPASAGLSAGVARTSPTIYVRMIRASRIQTSLSADLSVSLYRDDDYLAPEIPTLAASEPRVCVTSDHSTRC